MGEQLADEEKASVKESQSDRINIYEQKFPSSKERQTAPCREETRRAS